MTDCGSATPLFPVSLCVARLFVKSVALRSTFLPPALFSLHDSKRLDRISFFWENLSDFNRVWILSCFLRLLASLKDFPQCLHSYGFSPVWTRLWILRWSVWLKHLPHCLHPKGFSPVWTLLWFLIVFAWWNNLPHTVVEINSRRFRAGLLILKKHCIYNCLLQFSQGHPTTIFGKISVRKTIWDLEFSEHLL